MPNTKGVTCKVHFCEMHKGKDCPCHCIPCAKEIDALHWEMAVFGGEMEEVVEGDK